MAMSPKFFPARAVCLALLALWVVVLGEEAAAGVPEKMMAILTQRNGLFE